MASSGMLRRVALVRTDVSEAPSASFIRVIKIGELGTTLAVTGYLEPKKQLEGTSKHRILIIIPEGKRK
jgi:hypothetical protein